MDEKRLVADVEGGGVGGNGLAHDVRPGVDEALLEKGRLEALIPEVLEDYFLDEGTIAFEHRADLRFTNLRFTIYFAVVHVENFVVVGGGGEDLVEMRAVGVGDENLTELLSSDEDDNLFDAAGIEFVEDVVEE